MTNKSKLWLAVLMAALLGLYGCNQETESNKAEKAPEPEATEQAQESSETTTEQTASETVQEVEEAAEEVAAATQEVVEQASEAASNVAEQASEAASNVAEQADEAVNQAVEQAENAATEVAEEANEAVETAQTETEEAAEEVQETASESSDISQSTSVAPDHPEAFLSPADKLQADTLEAARHDRTQSKIPYIGAWASSPQGCAKIDQGVYDGFAVITPTQIRMFEEGCAITAGPMQSNPVVLDASCRAEGETNPSRITIEILKGPFIKLAHEGTSGFELVRCNLPR